ERAKRGRHVPAVRHQQQLRDALALEQRDALRRVLPRDARLRLAPAQRQAELLCGDAARDLGLRRRLALRPTDAAAERHRYARLAGQPPPVAQALERWRREVAE